MCLKHADVQLMRKQDYLAETKNITMNSNLATILD